MLQTSSSYFRSTKVQKDLHDTRTTKKKKRTMDTLDRLVKEVMEPQPVTSYWTQRYLWHPVTSVLSDTVCPKQKDGTYNLRRDSGRGQRLENLTLFFTHSVHQFLRCLQVQVPTIYFNSEGILNFKKFESLDHFFNSTLDVFIVILLSIWMAG